MIFSQNAPIMIRKAWKCEQEETEEVMWGSQGHWLGKQCTEKGENFTSACKVESKSMSGQQRDSRMLKPCMAFLPAELGWAEVQGLQGHFCSKSQRRTGCKRITSIFFLLVLFLEKSFIFTTTLHYFGRPLFYKKKNTIISSQHRQLYGANWGQIFLEGGH